jgi:hypothetical protein
MLGLGHHEYARHALLYSGPRSWGRHVDDPRLGRLASRSVASSDAVRLRQAFPVGNNEFKAPSVLGDGMS